MARWGLGLAVGFALIGGAPPVLAQVDPEVTETPGVTDRGAMERRLLTLRKQQSSAAAAKPTSDAPAVASTRPKPVGASPKESSVSPLPWMVTSAGILALGGGFALSVLSDAKHDEAVNEPDALVAAAKQDDAKGLALAATITLIGGGVVTGVGGVWGVLDLSSRAADQSDTRGVSLRLTPTSMQLSGRF